MDKKELIKQELLKCKNDPIYFIKKYIKIELVGGEITIPLYPKQEELVRSYLKDHYIIVLKSRQIGISTITQALCVYQMLFFPNVTIGVISRDGPEATDFVRKVKLMVDNLPSFMKLKFRKESQQSFEFSNKSRIIAASVNQSNPSGTLRGKTITMLVIDEAAFIRHIDEAYTAMIPAVFNAHKVAKERGIPYGVLILSTPNRTTGVGQWYYEQWKDAVSGQSEFKPIKIHYSDAPFATPEWIEKQKKILKSQLRIDQELELKFVTSESALFDNPQVVEEFSKSVPPKRKEPVAYFSKNLPVGKGEWYFWEEFNPNKYYLIGCDIASVTGNCKSAIEIVDMDLNQVAEFSGKLRITDFEKEMVKAVKMYPNCVLIPEANSYGSRTMEFLADNPDVGYALFYTRILDEKTGNIKKILPGLYTTGKTRPMMFEALFWAINEDPSRIKSERLALELMGIDKNFGSKRLSDLVMAYAFTCYVRKYQSKYLGINLDNDQTEMLEDMFGKPVGEYKEKPLDEEILDFFQ